MSTPMPRPRVDLKLLREDADSWESMSDDKGDIFMNTANLERAAADEIDELRQARCADYERLQEIIRDKDAELSELRARLTEAEADRDELRKKCEVASLFVKEYGDQIKEDAVQIGKVEQEISKTRARLKEAEHALRWYRDVCPSSWPEIGLRANDYFARHGGGHE